MNQGDEIKFKIDFQKKFLILGATSIARIGEDRLSDELGGGSEIFF